MISAALLLTLAQAAASPAPSATPSVKPAPAGPVVVLETSLGRIRIGLYGDKSPISTANFVKYAKGGFYDGTIFHRVIPGFMIQGGGMDAQLKEKATGAPIRNEAKNGVRNLRGTVAMARTNAPDSATAQFFINLKDNAFLDFGIRGAGYAVFGEVLEGMEVVDKIAAVQTGNRGEHSNVPETAVTIKTARVEGGAKTTAPAAGAGAAAKPAAKPSAKPSPKASPQS